MKRKIIEIDEDKCDGCGKCIPNCPEGALQLIDGKARLVSDVFCDGLGACVGYCPQGAITVTEREAGEYDEKKVMEESIVPKGKNTIKAHLKHLKDHGAKKYLDEAQEYLRDIGIQVPPELQDCSQGGCPGSKVVQPEHDETKGDGNSQLTNWPVQLHLLNASASFLNNSDLLLAADCTSYAAGNFHERFMQGKSVAIACPKLDSGLDMYEEKLAEMVKKVNSLSVAIMQVPCCSGLVRLALSAVEKSGTDLSIKKYVIGINGDVKSEETI